MRFNRIVALAAFVFVQTTTGVISGTVLDEQSAVLPGAAIQIKHTETGTTRSLITDEQGRFKAVALEPGTYEVSAELPGFQTTVRAGILLTLGQEAVIRMVLKVGAIQEKLVVTAEAPLVETTSSAVTNVVEENC